jgi:hypothetical protein
VRLHPTGGVQWGRLAAVDNRHACLLAGIELVIELRLRCLGRQEKVAVDPAEIAFDTFVCLDRFDTVDRGGLTAMDRAGRFDAARADQIGITIVPCGGEMSGGSGRHPAPDTAAIEHDHGAPAGSQLVGRGKPGDARPDYDDVGAFVTFERRRIGHRNVHPKGSGSFLGNVHDAVSGFQDNRRST